MSGDKLYLVAAPYLKQKADKVGGSLYELLGDDVHKMVIVRDEFKRDFKAFSTHSDFLAYMNSVKKENRCFHEIIFGDNHQRLKFDIDAPLDAIQDIDLSIIPKEYRDMYKGDCNTKSIAIINYIADSIVKLVNELFEQQLINAGYENGIRRKEHVMITESHGADKFSFHIIVIKFTLSNNAEVGWVTQKLCNSIAPPIAKLIDTGISKTIQNFRILGCMKAGTNRIKEISSSVETACDYGFIQFNKKDINLVSKFSKVSKSKASASTEQPISAEVLALSICHMTEKYPEFVYRNTEGNFINFTRLTSSYCDICERVHNNENSMMGFVIDNKLYRRCRRNQCNPDQDMRGSYLEMEFKSSSYDRCKALRQTIEDVDEDFEPLEPYLDGDGVRIYNKNKVKSIKSDKYDTEFIKAPMKLGKTKTLLEWVMSLPPDVTICILSFRKTFSKQILKMFKGFGFVSYNDFVGEITPKQHKRIIIQIESMHRIRDGVYDYVILDESESLIGQFANPDMKRKEMAFANFELNIKLCKKVICMDAFMSPRTIETIRNMRQSKNERISINTHKNATNYNYEIGYCHNYSYHKMLRALDDGKNIVIMANNRAMLESYRRMLDNDRPGLSMIDYTSKTDAGIKNHHMSNVNEHWVNYRVVLYTPTITAGISFEESHFHKVFAIFTNTTCDVLSCMQMMGRIREVIDKDITITLETKYKRCSTTIAGIERDLCLGHHELLSSVDNLGSPTATLNNGVIEYIYNTNSSAYKMWLLNEKEKNNSKRYFAQHLIECIKQTGASISVYNDIVIDTEVEAEAEAEAEAEDEDIEDEEGNPNADTTTDVRIRLRSIKREINEESLQELAIVDCIDKYQRNDLLSRQEDGDVLTVEESRMLEKYGLQKLYEVPDDVISSIDFLRKYYKDRTKNQFNNLKVILQSDTLEDSLSIIKQFEVSKYDRLRDKPTTLLDQRFTTDRHHNVINLLRISGFRHLFDEHTIPKDDLIDKYRKHENVIHRCCNVFNRPIPSVKANPKNQSIEESLFDSKLRTANCIINEWYGYKIVLDKKNKNSTQYKLEQKHPFFILRNYQDRESLPNDIPIIEYMPE